MKKLTSIIAIAFLMTLGFNAVAQNSATVANAEAAATIITPLALENTQILDFGKIVRSGVAGTVVINNAGERSFTGGASEFKNDQDFTHAIFAVTGENNATFNITLPTSDVTLTLDGGTETMKINNFTNSTSGTLNSTGTTQFNVGGTLNVSANQAAGLYEGTYSVTVAYN